MDGLGRASLDTESASLAFVPVHSQQASIALVCVSPAYASFAGDYHGSLLILIAASCICGRPVFQVMCAHSEIFKLLLKAWIGDRDQRGGSFPQSFPMQ